MVLNLIRNGYLQYPSSLIITPFRSIWEGRTSKLVEDDWESIKNKFGADDFSLAFARIENHYFTNKGFFPRDGFLLEKANIDKIRHIPTVIVQGRYDMVCPIRSAYDLKQAFPEVRLCTYVVMLIRTLESK